MPYVMLQGLRKKAKQRQQHREAMEAEAGVVTGNAGSSRRKSAQTPRGRGGGGGSGGGRSRGGNDRGSSRCATCVPAPRPQDTRHDHDREHFAFVHPVFSIVTLFALLVSTSVDEAQYCTLSISPFLWAFCLSFCACGAPPSPFPSCMQPY